MELNKNSLHVAKGEVIAKGGMCVAEHPLAAKAGAEILLEGGNAVDAAVACAFAVGVVEPMMSGIGGGGAMLVHLAEENRCVAIDFLPRAPRRASPDMYRLVSNEPAFNLFGWPAVEGDANMLGHRSVMVPGAVAGLCLGHARYGRLPLDRVMEPAIRLAEEGYVVDWYICTMIASLARRLRQYAETASIFLPDGLPPSANVRTYLPAEPLRQSDLAETLRRISRNGPGEFYTGETARILVHDMADNGGLIDAEDLVAYQPTVSESLLHGSYRGFDLVTMPEPTGAVTALETLNILERFELPRDGFGSSDALHLMIEAQRIAFLDRFANLASAEHAAPGWRRLVDKDFAKHRAQAIRLDNADTDATGVKLPAGDGGCTTHLCAADADGNLVSLTNTVGDLFGSFVTPPNTGVLLNNGMVWFNPEAGHPNSVGGGKRPLSNATLFLGYHDGAPYMALGAPGGRRVITSILQVIAHHVDFGMTLQEAIAAPRVHCEGPIAQVDDRLPAESLSALEARGHELLRLEETYTSANFARPVGIVRDKTGALHSGVDVLRPAAAYGI